MPVHDKTKELDGVNRRADLGGGKEKIAQQHAKGKLTARERIEKLMDTGTFQEIGKFVTHDASGFEPEGSEPLGDGVVTGYGRINGRLTYVFAHDFTVFGGSMGEATSRKVVKIMDLALKNGAPLVALNDSGGARIQEGVLSLAGVSDVFFRNTLLSGVVPQISAVLGPCAGAAVYSPALSDFIMMVKRTSNMFVTGPDVVKTVIGESITFEELGGADVHAAETGVSHFLLENEEDCMSLIRRLLSYLPQNNSEFPPRVTSEDVASQESPSGVVPEDPNKTYDMLEVIRRLVDNGEYLEVHAGWAQSVTVGFARLDGESVGIVANQPLSLSGSLDVDSSIKAARFVRFCDSFNIPIVTLVDAPGYMPGSDQEHRGLIKHGSKLLFAYCEATVPKVTVIVRKAYGGAYCAMGSKYSKADINYAWPGSEIAVMGPEGAINIISRKEIESSDNKSEAAARLTGEYRAKFANPYVAASGGIIDEVIDPATTRAKVISALASLRNKKEFRPPKKHGNIQL